jgi:hypothetical protein
MPVTAPETVLRGRLIAALTAEFAPEKIKFLHDKLHDSRGREGSIGGVYPGATPTLLSNEVVVEPTVYVQLFGKWTAEVDPKKTVDPTPVEEWAERVRRACRADGFQGSTGATEHLWFYSVTNVAFPPDPGGNITRLLATVTGKAQNPALVETTL